MKRFHKCWLMLVGGVISMSTHSLVRGDDAALLKSLEGEWTVASHSLRGVSEKRFESAAFVINDSNRSEMKLTSGESSQFKFVPVVHDEKTKMFRFSIEEKFDSPSVGGGGPRKGICRINEKGELEIVEAGSSSDDFPVDFSNASKAKAIAWKLTRKPETKK